MEKTAVLENYLESYLTGLIVCGGMIVAIGAQNAYVLEPGRSGASTTGGRPVCAWHRILLFSRLACSESARL